MLDYFWLDNLGDYGDLAHARGLGNWNRLAATRHWGSMTAQSVIREPGKRLGAMLLEEGVITDGQLKEALRQQDKHGGVIGRVLVELGFLSESTLISFIVKQCKIPHISLTNYEISPELIQLIPQDICLRHALVPIDHLGNILTIAMTDPLDSGALEEVRALCPDLRIKPILCSWNQYEQVVRRLFPDQVAVAEPTEMSMDSLGLGPAATRSAGFKPPKSLAPAESSANSDADAGIGNTDGDVREIIARRIRDGVQSAMADIGTHLQRHLAQNQALPVSTSELVTAVESAARDSLDEALGVLLYQVQNALDRDALLARDLTPEQLGELLRNSMRQALADTAPAMMLEAANAIVERHAPRRK